MNTTLKPGDEVRVEYRTSSRTDDWHPAPGMNPAEVSEMNQIMGWAKYRITVGTTTDSTTKDDR